MISRAGTPPAAPPAAGEAEGCFSVVIFKSKTSKLGEAIKLSFNLTQHTIPPSPPSEQGCLIPPSCGGARRRGDEEPAGGGIGKREMVAVISRLVL